MADLIVLSDCYVGPGAACSAAVNVLFGNRDGTFQPRIEYVAGRAPLSLLAVTDLDGDGVPDVLMRGHSELAVLHPTCLQ